MKKNRFLLFILLALVIATVSVLAACDKDNSTQKATDYSKYNWVCREKVCDKDGNMQEVVNDKGNLYDTDVMIAVGQFIDLKTFKNNSDYGDKGIRDFFGYFYDNNLELEKGYAYQFSSISLACYDGGDVLKFEFSKPVKAAYYLDKTEKLEYKKLNVSSDGLIVDLSENSIENVGEIVAICDFSDSDPLEMKITEKNFVSTPVNADETIHLEAGQSRVIAMNVAESKYAYFTATAKLNVIEYLGNSLSTHVTNRTVGFTVIPDNLSEDSFNLYEKGMHRFLVTNPLETAIDFTVKLEEPSEIELDEAVQESETGRWYAFTVPAGVTYYDDTDNFSYVSWYIDNGKCVKNDGRVIENHTSEPKKLLIKVHCKNNFSLVKIPAAVGYKVDNVRCGNEIALKAGESVNVGFYVGNNKLDDIYTQIVVKDENHLQDCIEIEGDIISTENVGDIKTVTVKGEFKASADSSLSKDDVFSVSVLKADLSKINLNDIATLLNDNGYSCDVATVEANSSYYNSCNSATCKVVSDETVYANSAFEAVSDEIGFGVSLKMALSDYEKLFDQKEQKLSVVMNNIAAYSSDGSIMLTAQGVAEEGSIVGDYIYFKNYFVKYSEGNQNALFGKNKFSVKGVAVLENNGGSYLENGFARFETSIDLSNDAKWLAYVSR